MEIIHPTISDADTLADCWVELAADQRQYGSRLLPKENREAVAETIAQHIVTDGLLVARESTVDTPGSPAHPSPGGERGAEGRRGPGGPGGDGSPQDPRDLVDSGGDRSPQDPRDLVDPGEPGDSDAILGFVMYRVEDGRYLQDCLTGVIVNLYVRPAARDKGIGSELLAAAESELAAEGVDTVTLEVLAANEAARRFYARHGYDPHRVELAKRIENDTHSKDDP